MKIQIKTLLGRVLFEYDCENNSIRKTLVELVKIEADLTMADLRWADLRGADLREAYLTMADLREADLRGVNLRGADLRGVNLRGVNLRGVNLRGVNLRGADLRGVNLRGADLTEADLTGVNLRGADLTGADLTGVNDNKIKIKEAAVFTGLYKYIVIPFIDKDDIKWVKMGCYTRKLSEWNKDFWNNDNEFPNNGCKESNSRVFAFEVAKKWFKQNSK